jgi:hypothetical protein
MDLPSISNAPRVLPVAGVSYRACVLTLRQLAELAAWLEDRTGIACVPLSCDAARVALASTDGLAVILHLSLLDCQPGLTRDEAAAMASALDEETTSRLMAIAFRRRPGYKPPPDGSGKDLAESDWGAIWEGLTRHRAELYGAVGGLTLDQLDNLAAKGELEGPDALSAAEVQAMWEAADGQGFVEDADAV